METILFRLKEDTYSAQEEFNALKASSRKKKRKMDLHNKNTRMETENNITTKLIVVALLSLLVGFGIGFLVFGDKEGASNDATFEEVDSTTEDILDLGSASETPAPVVVDGVSLVVSDQNFGDTVFVDSVSLDRASWIVVYEDNNGVAGNILGAHLYDEGVLTQVSVTLLRATEPASLYYVKIHADDGDREFDFKKDIPVVDSAQQEIVGTFTTSDGTPR